MDFSFIYTFPYTLAKSTFQFTAEVLHTTAGPAVEWAGYTIQWATDPYNQFRAPALLSTAAFAFFAYKGTDLALAPLKERDKWINIKPRFKSTPELKQNLLDLSKLGDHLNIEKEVAAQKDYDKAKDALEKAVQVLDNRLVSFPNPAADPEAKRLADAVEKAQVEEKRCADKLQKAKDEASKSKDKDLSSKTNGLLNLKIEKTEKSNEETHIPIPLSNEAIVIDRDKMKTILIKSGFGCLTIPVSSLGLLDSLNGVFNVNISEALLGKGLSNFAWTIGAPTRCVGYATGYVIGGVTRLNAASYGIGNIGGAIGLAYGGYRVLKSTNRVWFKFNSDPGNDKIQYAVIRKDLAKIVGGISMISGSILLANAFLTPAKN